MKTPILCTMAIILFGAKATSATITSSTGYVDLADSGSPYPYGGEGGGPSFSLTAPWYRYWGSIKVASDPDEQIFNLVLNFRRDSNQPYLNFIAYEHFIGNQTYQGGYLGQLIQPPDTVLQEWKVDWDTNYLDGWYNSMVYHPRKVVLTGTATLVVSSSSGEYDLATYSYSYLGVAVPEPSSGILVLLGTACVCGYRRRLPKS